MDNTYINKSVYNDPNLVTMANAMNDVYNIDFTNVTSIVNYVINHYEKFLLLLLVVLMVWAIDYITNINTILYGATQIPFLPASSNNSPPPIKKPKKK